MQHTKLRGLYIVVTLLLIIVDSDAYGLQVIEGEGRCYPVAEKSKSQAIAKAYQNAPRQKPGPKELEKKWVVRLEEQPRLSTRERKRLVDITFTLPFDIKGRDGALIKKKGEQYNPLAKIKMTSLIVIDGENKEHIEWARAQQKALTTAKILISKGSFLTVMRKHKLRVYHLKDIMMERFQIEKVPCTVIQNGQKLEVMEFPSPSL
jgi:hypothetical protein